MKERIKIAVEFLKEGQSFKIGDLRLGMNSKHEMYVTGWSQYSNIKALTKSIALSELYEIKNLFQEMINSSIELKKFIDEKEVEFNLASEYGQGAIGICSEVNDRIVWHIELE